MNFKYNIGDCFSYGRVIHKIIRRYYNEKSQKLCYDLVAHRKDLTDIESNEVHESTLDGLERVSTQDEDNQI